MAIPLPFIFARTEIEIIHRENPFVENIRIAMRLHPYRLYEALSKAEAICISLVFARKSARTDEAIHRTVNILENVESANNSNNS